MPELWTWERCSTSILSLKNRLGFDEEICFLEFCIKENGKVHDNLNEELVSAPGPLYWVLTHYAEAEEVPLACELVTYDKLPGGYAFYGAFCQLAINPLLEVFGENLDEFEKCCLYFKGERRSFGDMSFQIPVLPFVPIIVVIWIKSDEFPPRCTILFDKSASNYLPTEDLAYLGELLSRRLIEAAKKGLP